MDVATRTELRRISNEINAAVSALNGPEAVEYRRRKDVADAVLDLARPALWKLTELRASYQSRQSSNKALWWFSGACVFGGVWHYFARDSTKPWNAWDDWTLGSVLMVLSFIIFLLYQWQTIEMARDLNHAQERCSDLLFWWLANGGSEARFAEFQKLVIESQSGRDYSEAQWRWEIDYLANLL